MIARNIPEIVLIASAQVQMDAINDSFILNSFLHWIIRDSLKDQPALAYNVMELFQSVRLRPFSCPSASIQLLA